MDEFISQSHYHDIQLSCWFPLIFSKNFVQNHAMLIYEQILLLNIFKKSKNVNYLAIKLFESSQVYLRALKWVLVREINFEIKIKPFALVNIAAQKNSEFLRKLFLL